LFNSRYDCNWDILLSNQKSNCFLRFLARSLVKKVLISLFPISHQIIDFYLIVFILHLIIGSVIYSKHHWRKFVEKNMLIYKLSFKVKLHLMHIYINIWIRLNRISCCCCCPIIFNLNWSDLCFDVNTIKLKYR
jgi:hypothetical protein